MSGQVTAAIIALAAAVIVAVLGYWFNKRIEQRKQVAQRASTAFVEGVAAIAENQVCFALLGAPGKHLSEDEQAHWRQRAFEAEIAFNSAKACIAAYGNSEANCLLADIERQGGVTGDNKDIRQKAARVVLSFRKELGFKKNDISERDIATLLFGPIEEDRKEPFIGWPKRPPL